MEIVRTSIPEFLPVTRAEAREQLRIEEDEVDAARDKNIDRALLSALDYAALKTSRLLIRGLYAARIECWPCSRRLEIPAGPVLSVDEITYYDGDDVAQVIDAADYNVEILSDRAYIVFKSTYRQPTLTQDRSQRIVVAFTGGYDNPDETGSGDDPALRFPANIKHGILMRMEAEFEAGSVDDDKITALKTAADDVFETMRVFRA